MNQDTYIVVPAYREAAVIGQVVRDLRRQYAAVVVVDDGSRDDTAAIARQAGAIVLRHIVNRGQGAALQTGIEYALRAGARYVVTFDADGQHSLESIAALLEPLRGGLAEISLGSRFLGSTEGMPWSRFVLLKTAVLFTRAVTGLRVTDTHNGLRALTRRAAEQIHITLDRMAHASELLDQVRSSGLPWVEVPVHIRYGSYHLAKGQRSSGAIRILIDYLVKRAFG